MKPYPGLTVAETEALKARIGLVRCQTCAACKLVKDTGRLVMPNPPFEHATDGTVKCWNRVLFDNPCETWKV